MAWDKVGTGIAGAIVSAICWTMTASFIKCFWNYWWVENQLCQQLFNKHVQTQQSDSKHIFLLSWNIHSVGIFV